MRRRKVLAAVGGTGVGTLAGCLAGRFEDECPPRSDAETPPDGWPMPGGDPGNTAVSTDGGPRTARNGETSLETSAIEQWRVSAWDAADDDVSGAASAPVVDGERVYLAYGLPRNWTRSVDVGTLLALEEATGTVDWQYTLSGGASGAPVLLGESVLVGNADGTLARLDASGDREWEVDLGAAVRTPAVANGWCYVQCDDGRVHAIDAASGERCWDARPGGFRERLGFGEEYETRGRPAVTDGTVVVTTGIADRSSGVVRALERTTGAQRWSFELEATYRPPRSPVVSDGIVYAAAAGRLHAVTLADGEREWTFGTGVDETSAPAVGENTVYCSANNVYAIDRETGAERWRHVTLAPDTSSIGGPEWVPLTGTPSVTDDLVAVGFGALDRETGEPLWGEVGNEAESEYFHRGFPRPRGTMAGQAIANGALYASTIEGLVAKVKP